MTGSSRTSYRKSVRGPSRSQTGDATEKLQVIVDGIDRTPKPLLATRNIASKGGPEESTTPTSDQSEFFMDRMSTAFSTKGGWFSNADSGTQTPKSEADYDYEAEKRDRDRKAAEEAAQAAVAGEEGPDSARAYPAPQEEPMPPQLLTERDLDRSAYISLSETETIFILQMPGVTVAIDSEEAKLVEEANKRYANLLQTKQAADKYVDAEAQTLVALQKSREVQSAVLKTMATSVQATAWDISDQFRLLDEGAADAEDDTRAANVPNITQLAAGVVRYMGKGAGLKNEASGATAAAASMYGGQSMMGRPSVAYGGGQSAMYGSPSFMSGYAGAASVSANAAAGLPPGVPTEAAAAHPVAPPDDPLHGLRGLAESLTIMDHAINQNNYLAQLLLYRDVQAHPGGSSGGPRSAYHQGDDDESDGGMSHIGAMRPMSAAPSDGGRSMYAESVGARSQAPRAPQVPAAQQLQVSISRQSSARSAMIQRAMSVRDSNTVDNKATSARPSQSGIAGLGHGGPAPGYAASMAESNWPEELLQELANLGDDAPRLEHLWDWVCPLTAGKNVAAMAWNKVNPDLLAVGYGSFTFASTSDEQGAAAVSTGMVAFWSLKNPQYPVWWFETQSSVTALDFSMYNPNMLAVGLYDGTLAIYDIKARQGTPAMESDVHSGKHADPVWKVRWIDRGPERDEPLVSISTDGRVTQWSIAKGLEFSDLMKLKRMARRGTGAATSAAAAAATGKAGGAAAAAAGGGASEQQDAFISRLTSGMAFDFSARDERIYVAATEDGWLHKCSTSYSEQYLESYRGHMGPVYQVQFSPYKQDMFISASADWTLRMWAEGRDTPLLTFQASSTEVNDVQWCPANSTVFGDVTSSGRLEIWDFALSTVKPVMHAKASEARLSCLLFSPTCPVVVCGGEDGAVKAYRLTNVAREYETREEQEERLELTIRANVMKSAAAGTQQL